MIQKDLIKVSYNKNIVLLFLLFFLILLFGGRAYSQCLNATDVENTKFKINTVYYLDSLVVSKNLVKILDNSVDLVDKFNVNMDSTWLYYVFCMSSIYNNDEGVLIKIELLQGTEYNIFFDRLVDEGEEFSGAFCYKGYTFFVLSDSVNNSLFFDLFTIQNKAYFNVYYNKPESSEEWKKLDIHGVWKFINSFYKYNDGDFNYLSTKVLN